jgi:hypothetical protein
VESTLSFIGELVSRVNMNWAIALGTIVMGAVLVIPVLLMLARRINRSEEFLIQLRELQKTMHETQTDNARVVASLSCIENAVPAMLELKQQWGSVNSQHSQLMGAVARISIDVENLHKLIASGIDVPHAETISITVAAMSKIESEQHEIYKLLKAWNSRFQGIEEMISAVPRVQGEQVQMRNELRDWNSRVNAACEALAEAIQPEDTKERLPTSHVAVVPWDFAPGSPYAAQLPE